MAVVYRYSANPTVLGNSAGTVRAMRIFSSNLTSSANNPISIFDFDDFQTNPIVLRGSQEYLCLNFNSVALPGGMSVISNITWKETPIHQSWPSLIL